MIDLTRESIQKEEIEGQQVWPLKVTAVSNTAGLSSKIFVFHASMDDDMYAGDLFEAVASVQQITDLPEDEAGNDINGEVVPYFRSDSFVFLARSPSEADELWDDIVEDVDDLARNWSAMSDLESEGTFTRELTLKDNLNAGARDITNVEEIGIRTVSPAAAIDIDPDNPPTTSARGIRIGGDVELFRTGTNAMTIDAIVNIVGTLLINGVALSGTGTVTSVAINGNDGLEVDSGSPVTSSGTIELGLGNIDSPDTVIDGGLL